MAELSVLIPARNEMWLGRTVADLLAHSKADTEIIVVLDGEWPTEPLPQHPKVHVVYVPQSIGQRSATNLAARISQAAYICKMDAHCSVAEGWDVELIRAAKELGPMVTQVPAQYNLHVFDWVCDGCDKRTYQGPTPTECDHCKGSVFHRDVKWQRRRGVLTTAWSFDSDLKFQYAQKVEGPITDTLSCLGACWFLSRARYWELGGLDEEHGSWGQMGTEIGCKSWLSGGRLVCNQQTWFAHLFRTQGGDFGFPYPQSGRQVDHARAHSRKLFKDGAWPQATRSLESLLKQFWPVKGWEAPAVKTSKTPRTRGIVYYSDCLPESRILEASRRTIEASGMPIAAVTLAPIKWPSARNIVLESERGYLTMFRQILAGLEALDTDVAFLCEHDVLYHRSHFAYTAEDNRTYYYNQNVWKLNSETGHALHYLCNQTSGLSADRQLLVNHYRARVAAVSAHGFSRRNGFEPGTRQVRHGGFDDYVARTYFSEHPNVDIRHGANLTSSRWKQSEFRNQKFCQGWQEGSSVPGWGETAGRFAEFLREVSGVTDAAAEAA